ncbi:MAG: flagellar hook-basal body complex protein [Candidatus Brocadiae bacterium]|nr:flagellar hook-basal body complex protein [Candidatus Brocadiia bacterium]
MASALQTAVLGMRAYQEMLNVTGNNIANADTTGYKEDRITFSDMFSRTLSRGMRASEDIGGTNPIQVGLGVRVSSVDKNMAQGSFTSTEKDFDLALDGAGFFVVNDGISNLFSRDGTFDVDSEGYLVDPSTGHRVQRMGTTGEEFGFQLQGSSDILIPYRTELPGNRTEEIDFKGNLSASDYEPTTTRLQASGMVYTLTAGGIADATRDFSEVDQLLSFVAGETIAIAGKQTDGTAVSGTFTYGPGVGQDGTTIQDLLDVITAAFGGASACTATLEEGKLILREANEGYSLMDIDLSSAAQPAAMPLDFDYLNVGGATAQTTNISIYDRQSRNHSLTVSFVRHGAYDNVWDLVVNSCSGASGIPDRRIAGITFDENGIYQGISETDAFGNTSADPGFADLDANVSLEFPGIASVQDIVANFGRAGFYDGLTQLGGDSSAGAIDQDGYGTGALQSISIDGSGTLSGTFSNGETMEVADLRLAVFGNPQGLERIGANYYRHTPAAGSIIYSQGQQGRAGAVRQNVLEDSNVDIAREFTRLIVAQRGFQVNSRTVRVTNNILQQLATIVT